MHTSYEWLGGKPPTDTNDPRAFAGRIYCGLPECLEIKDCAHRIDGRNCAAFPTRNMPVETKPPQPAVTMNNPLYSPVMALTAAAASVGVPIAPASKPKVRRVQNGDERYWETLGADGQWTRL